MGEMDYKELTCQEHGGTFLVPKKAGRPPRNCNADNVCNRAKAKASASGGRKPSVVANTAAARRARQQEAAERASAKQSPAAKARRAIASYAKPAPVVVPAEKPTASRPPASSTVITHNPSVPEAHKAKGVLEPLGWLTKGTAWSDDSQWAQLTARRGVETLIITWRDGKLDSTHYSLWDESETPYGMPRRRLKFNPDEMNDAQLIQVLAGQKVTWWNRLGGFTQTATMPTDLTRHLKVEHMFDKSGEEDRRTVSFVDRTTNGFTAFAVDALIKVG